MGAGAGLGQRRCFFGFSSREAPPLYIPYFAILDQAPGNTNIAEEGNAPITNSILGINSKFFADMLRIMSLTYRKKSRIFQPPEI